MDAFILAAGTTAVDTTTFWSTSIGTAIKAVLIGVGIVVVLACAFKAIKDVSAGKPGGAVKVLVAGAALASVLFFPEIISDLIGLMGDIISKIVSSVKDLTGGSSATPGTPAI